MAKKADFRSPVFVRNDDESNVEASVVVWGEEFEGDISVRIANGNGGVLIKREDWATLVSCVNAELNKVT